MRGLVALLTLSLVCGLCRTETHTAKHFQTVYSWSGIDFVFPDEAARNTSLHDGSFAPGTSVPWGMDVDPVSGRMFMSFVKSSTGTPVSLATVSGITNSKGEHFLEAYPDWSWHTKGCDGITSVEKIAIDECGRLWVMDSGASYPANSISFRPSHVCPAQILVFDLKTNELLKKHVFHESFIDNDSVFSTIVVEVESTDNECKNTFAYVADAGNYALVVYDLAKDESWLTYSNEMYPSPDSGHFNVGGVEFDYMFGIYSLAMSPKNGDHGRSLYFNSLASSKETHVKTSVLKHKENFVHYNHVQKEFVTFPHSRPGRQTGSEVISEDGILFFNSLEDTSFYCWNHKSDFSPEHFAMVDKDDEAFQMIGDMKIVKKDGVEELYIMSNQFQKFMFGNPGLEEVHFRVMKAPVHTLTAGSVCAHH